jgi:uncharacterized protein
MTMSFLDIPLVDHHCHSLVDSTRATDAEALLHITSEAPTTYPMVDLQQRLAWQASLEIIRRFTGQTTTTLDEVRGVMASVNYADYCRTLFTSAGYAKLYVDTGFAPAAAPSLEGLAELTGTQVYPVLRLEQVAEREFRPELSFDEWWQSVWYQIESARDNGYIGAKSIAAYRGGLHLHSVSLAEAKESYQVWVNSGSGRLSEPTLLHYLVWQAAPLLAKQSLPLQFHTGYGDPDTDLLLGNPLHLKEFIEAFTPQGLSVVLLHTYPYHREAGFLTSVYPGVYFDTSLINPLGPAATRRVVAEALELTPYSRYLFASDAHTRPEMYVLAAELFKDAFALHLEDALVTRYTRPEVRESFAMQVLAENARRLYLGVER